MKLKLSPFIILFFLLNTTLIICAFTKIDSEEKPASGLTYTSTNNPIRPIDIIDPQGSDAWVKKNKARQSAKALTQGHTKEDVAEGSYKQKTADFPNMVSADN